MEDSSLPEFYRLDAFLRNEDALLDTGNIMPQNKAESARIQVYQFHSGAIIRKETQDHSPVDVRATGFPECRYTKVPKRGDDVIYFVLDEKGHFVSRIIDAVNIVSESSGVTITNPDVSFSYPTLAVKRDIVVDKSAYGVILSKIRNNMPADAIVELPFSL